MQECIKLLLAGLAFASCTGSSNRDKRDKKQLPAPTTYKLDTARNKPYTVTAEPGIFETAYFHGTTTPYDDTTSLTFYTINLGKLDMPTGKVVACDPVMTHLQSAFITQFPRGQFPVQLAIAKVNDNVNQMIAFSRILFSEEPVAKWEFALKEGQKQKSIFGDSSYCYPVDAGLGQFMDESSFKRLEELEQDTHSQFMDTLFAQLDKPSFQYWQYANTNYKDINLVAFTSGFGDGCYTTYIGYDKAGSPCRLLTDFGLVYWLKK